MFRAQKVRLYPNKEQQQMIYAHMGGTRYVYNRTLALKKYAYKKFGVSIGKFALMKHIVKLKKRKQLSWLKNITAQSIEQSIENMDKAYKNFFKGAGYPKFKSKHNSRQSYQYRQGVRVTDNEVYLPKIGWVKCRGLRKEFIGKIKTSTVTYEAQQYHIGILVDLENESSASCNNPDKAIGIDVGVSFLVSDSDGNKIKPLNLTNGLKKLKIRSQQLSRKKKGSNNRLKAKTKLVKIHLKIRNKRVDTLHKLSFQYAENQGIVVVEDLKIQNMTKATKGTIEKPSKNASAKRGLNRVITQQGWGLFFEFLQYKLEERGGQLIKVDPKHTSQTCNECGNVSKDNRKSQVKFVCISCGYSANADINASKNILDRGVRGNNASGKMAV